MCDSSVLPSGFHEKLHWVFGINIRGAAMLRDSHFIFADSVNYGRMFMVEKVIVAGSQRFMRLLERVELIIGNKVYLDVPAPAYLEIAISPIDALSLGGVDRPIQLPVRFVFPIKVRLALHSQHFQLKAMIDSERAALSEPLDRRDYVSLALDGTLHRPLN